MLKALPPPPPSGARESVLAQGSWAGGIRKEETSQVLTRSEASSLQERETWLRTEVTKARAGLRGLLVSHLRGTGRRVQGPHNPQPPRPPYTILLEAEGEGLLHRFIRQRPD